MHSNKLASPASHPQDNIVVIHQPDFIPYLGFFHRLLYADLFVVLDNVQFVHGRSDTWIQRDKIKTQQGVKWITANVKKAPSDTPINNICLSQDTNWKRSHLNILRESYRKAPFFHEIFPHIQRIYEESYSKLADFNMKFIHIFMDIFDVKIRIVMASSLHPVGRKNELLLDILSKTSATHYFSGVGARDFLDEDLFHKAGLSVIWQDFKHPIYPQLHGEFIPNLSSIDILFNCGIEGSRKLLRSCV